MIYLLKHTANGETAKAVKDILREALNTYTTRDDLLIAVSAAQAIALAALADNVGRLAAHDDADRQPSPE